MENHIYQKDTDVNIFFAIFFSGYQKGIMIIMSGTGKTIRMLRTAAGLTQRQLAQMVGRKPEQISHIETGRRSLGPKLKPLFAQAFGIPVKELQRLIQADGDEKLIRILWMLHHLPDTDRLKDAFLELMEIKELTHSKGLPDYLETLLAHIHAQAELIKKVSR